MGKWQTSVVVPGPREQVFDLLRAAALSPADTAKFIERKTGDIT